MLSVYNVTTLSFNFGNSNSRRPSEISRAFKPFFGFFWPLRAPYAMDIVYFEVIWVNLTRYCWTFYSGPRRCRSVRDTMQIKLQVNILEGLRTEYVLFACPIIIKISNASKSNKPWILFTWFNLQT